MEFDAVFTSAYKGIIIQTGFSIEYGYQFPFKSFKFGYQRKEEKPHGEEGIVVGYLPKRGDRVLLLDDVFTTGYSINEMIKFIKGYGAIPVLAAVLILRDESGTFDKFKKQSGIDIRYLAHDDEVSSVYNQYKK